MKRSSFTTIEEKLKNAPRIMLDEKSRERLKNRLFASMRAKTEDERLGVPTLAVQLRALAQKIILPSERQSILRERILALVHYHCQAFHFRFSAWFAGSFARRAAASLVLFLFAFTSIFHFAFPIPTVAAASLTTIESVNGNVQILRGSEVLLASPGFRLRADDVVKTGASSKVVIRFLDQSVSRLDENTDLKIAKLFVNPANRTETVVELILERGRVWSRVINLIDNVSHFQVKANSTVAVAKKKAAFAVSVSPKGKATVAAIKNKVDLVVATEKKVTETTLVNGFSAEVKSDSALAAPKITKDGKDGQADAWVASNLAEDEKYIAAVKQEVNHELQGQAQVLPGNPLYAVKELSEGAKIAFTFDDVDRKRKIVLAAGQKLAEAQGLLARGEAEEAAALIIKFKEDLDGVIAWAKQFQGGQDAELIALRTEVNEMLDTYEKKFALLLPADPLYPLKTAISEIKIALADSPAAQTEERLAQASGKLLEAHDLADQGDQAQATEQVKAYQDAISEVASEVKELSNDEKEKAVSAFLDTKVEDLKVLQAMTQGTSSAAQSQNLLPASNNALLPVPAEEKTPEGVPSAAGTSSEEIVLPLPPQSSAITGKNEPNAAGALLQSLKDAKKETLTNIGEAVLQVQQDNPSVPVLQKLQELKKLDVNGKPFVNVTVAKDSVKVRSNGTVISVVGTSTFDTKVVRPADPLAPLSVGSSTRLPLPTEGLKIPK